MHRNYLRGLIYILIPTIFFGAFAFLKKPRPGIDLAGGTILVYELEDAGKASSGAGGGTFKVTYKGAEDRPAIVRLANDPTKNADDAEKAAGQDASENKVDMQQLVESLKRRIDPVDTKNVIIRPEGNKRVEISLPFVPKRGGADDTSGTEDFVAFIKKVVSQQGVLEFRILANNTDDKEGIAAARDAIANMPASDAEARAKNGDLPPAPEAVFQNIDVNGTKAAVKYEWREIGIEERRSLGLDRTSPLYLELEAARKANPAEKRNPVLHTNTTSGKDGRAKEVSMLIYSREFQKLNPRDDEKETKGPDGKVRAPKKVEYFLLTRKSPDDQPPLDSLKIGDFGTNLTAEAANDTGDWKVKFGFTSGGNYLTRLTERNRPSDSTARNMAILLDGRVVTAPTLQSRLDGGGEITGSYTKAAVDEIVYILRSGALSAKLKPQPVNEYFVGPTLGQDTRVKGLWSIGLSFGAVMLFMVYYYRFAGVVACIALLINLLLTIGFMNAVNAAYTLAGLAGIVLMLGMAVDANVLIYERIREERAKGAALAAALRAGYDRALPTIIDTHLTSIFTAVVLYAFGNDNLKGFAVSLTVGLIISLFTALYVTRLIFDFWLKKTRATDLKMLKLFSRTNIDFMAIRKQVFAITVFLTVAGLGLFLLRGSDVLDVDFRGGTVYGGMLKEPMPLETLRGKLSEDNQKSRLEVADVVYWGDTTKLSPEEEAALPAKIAAVKARAKTLPDVSVEQVFLGEEKTALPSGTSKSFTVRTTEREPELVKAMLDQLLRGDGDKPLLDTVTLTVGAFDGLDIPLTFSEPTSKEYAEQLILNAFIEDNRRFETDKPFTLKAVASKDPGEAALEQTTGKFRTMVLTMQARDEFKDLSDIDPRKQDAAKKYVSSLLETAAKSFAGQPVPSRLETFDSTLARDTKSKAAAAIVASWVAILLFLWFRFGSWTFGLAAVLCLIHDLCFTLGAIALCHYLHAIPVFGPVLQIADFKINLAAVAALLTLVGYSVNDTIVVFDRIREVRGKNPSLTIKMINDSVNQTLSRTVLASLTVFLVVGVLYFFGGEGVHLFAFVMVVGVLVGTFSSIYVASPLLLLLGEGQPKAEAKKPELAATAS